MGTREDAIRLLLTGETDPLGNPIVQGCPFPDWCRFTPGPLHRHSIIPTGEPPEVRQLRELRLWLVRRCDMAPPCDRCCYCRVRLVLDRR